MAQAQSNINEPAQNFFAQLIDGYGKAANGSGSALQFNYQIGGKQIRICYASEECVQTFAPALQHQRCSAFSSGGQEPDFTIWVWDSISTGVPTPRAPWALEEYLPNHLIRGYCDERFRTLAYYDAAVCLMIDLQTNSAVYWRRNIHETLDYERAAPFRELFCWWMMAQGRYFIHGGAVDGIFLAGMGGVGKSTTALACLAQGLGWVGEDYVLLAAEEAAHAYSLYCTAKLSSFSLGLLPQFREDVVISPPDPAEKSILNLYPHYAEHLRSRVEIRAVVLPSIGKQKETQLRPTTSGEIFRPLVSSTLRQIPGIDSTLVQGIAHLLRQLPCYRLELGRDLDQVVDCLRTLGRGE